MEARLTEEAVELQQCARPRNPNTVPLHYPGSPPPTKSTFGRADIKHDTHFEMAATTESVFVEDVDVERELRARVRNSNQSPKSGASSPGPDNDNEDSPLLSTFRDDYGGAHDDSDDSSEAEWTGDIDFRGLPWWKRPSVGASRLAPCYVDD